VIATPPAADAAATPESPPSTGIQTEERIPLPPVPPRPRVSPEKLRRRLGILEGIIAVLLLVFAFECAAFRASNSDVFLHLAAGRLVAEGQLSHAGDPFTFSSDRPWVHHSWLTDAVAYQIYQIAGGDAILVGLKAGLAVLLAILMLATARQPDRLGWVPVVCVFLAILTISPHLFLRPTIVSFVLLALTLYLLTRPGDSRAVWLLPVVCLLWVNLDNWFLLGPLTIALYLAGQLLQKISGETAGAPGVPPGRLAAVLALSVLACLVNPAHIGAFTTRPVPFDFSQASAVLRIEPQFRGQFLSPLESIWFIKSLGLSAAGLSFFLLLGIGLGSFIVVAPRMCWWRVLIWLSFAGLALWSVRLIPFFAIVGAPIAALNFLDGSARLWGTEIHTDLASRQWAVAGRFLSVVAALLLVALAVPGWLQAMPHANRQVGLGIQVDEGLRDAALQVARWRKEGALPAEAHWFNTSPEVANYFAYFCPGEKMFLDIRLPQYSGAVAREFLDAHRALQGRTLPEEDKDQRRQQFAWRKIFADRQVKFVVFHANDLARQGVTLERLYSNPDEFNPCYAGGTAAIFAWRDPEKSRAGRLDPRLVRHFDEEAFGPQAEPAPDTRPAAPGSQPWWKEILPGAPGSTKERGTAHQQTLRFHALRPRYGFEYHKQFRASMAAGLPCMSGGLGGPVVNGALLPLRMNYAYNFYEGKLKSLTLMDQRAVQALERFRGMQDQGPPSALYLAVRAARRALQQLPDDTSTYLTLAESYNTLATLTRERRLSESPLFLHPAVIRRSQLSAALNNILKLDPPPEVAQAVHGLLIRNVYRPLYDAGPGLPPSPDWYFELRVHHFRELVKLHQGMKPPSGVPEKDFKKALEQEEAQLKREEQNLKTQRNKYEVNSANKPVLQKIEQALQNGLAETALGVLRKAEVKELIDPRTNVAIGGQRLVELLLATGQTEEARQVLEPDPANSDKKGNLGALATVRAPAYEWFQAQLAAATGDYAEADRALGECIEALAKEIPVWTLLGQLDIVPPGFGGESAGNLGTFAGLATGHVLLQLARMSNLPWQPDHLLVRKLLPPHNPRDPRWYVSMAVTAQVVEQMLRPQADLWAVRAWLSLEAGHIARAREQAVKAISLGGDAKGSRRFVRYQSHLLAALVLELTEPGKK
jgi:hypothetical protein